MPEHAVLQPWRCAGTLRSGRPCNRELAQVDYERPMYIRAVCPRCEHENTLVERYAPKDARVHDYQPQQAACP